MSQPTGQHGASFPSQTSYLTYPVIQIAIGDTLAECNIETIVIEMFNEGIPTVGDTC